jgi:hypothetical protein
MACGGLEGCLGDRAADLGSVVRRDGVGATTSGLSCVDGGGINTVVVLGRQAVRAASTALLDASIILGNSSRQ